MDVTVNSGNEESFIPTRSTLLCKIRDWRDEKSWQDFYTLYRKMVLRIAQKSGLNNIAAEEVMQDTMVAVATSIDHYKYEPEHCSFKGWLLHLTRCRIADYYRKKQRRIPSVALDLLKNIDADKKIEELPALLPDSEWDVEWQKGLMEVALDNIRSKVNPRHFQAFDFYVIKNWPPAKVAQTLNISLAQIYLAKYRISARLKKEIQSLKEKWG
jgi:RNA polymerase sigma-70 factor (ECF subfamily)